MPPHLSLKNVSFFRNWSEGVERGATVNPPERLPTTIFGHIIAGINTGKMPLLSCIDSLSTPDLVVKNSCSCISRDG